MKLATSFLAALIMLVAACSDGAGTATIAPSGDREASFEVATPPQAAAIIDSRLGSDGFVLLDVRTPEEYAEGHIAGSENVDFYEPAFADNIGQLDRDASYVVYCRSGNRSGQTTELMRQLGFTDVTDISGGIVAWQSEGLPTQ